MRITVNDTTIYFDAASSQLEIAGGGLRARPSLVALHGGPGFDHGYLRPGLEPLGRHAQVVFVDLRGQGRSGPAPVATCTLEQMADDVAGLCRHVGIDRPVLFGHSAGGFVALHVALRHPALLGGLILCATSATRVPVPDPAPPPSLAERAGSEAVEIATRVFAGDVSPDAMAAFGARVAPFYAGPAHQDVPARLLGLSSVTTEVMRHFFTTAAGTFDVRPRLGEIDVATLVVAGGYDWVCPPSANRALAAGIPRARLVEIETAGHFPFSEEPDRFGAAVTPFLRAR